MDSADPVIKLLLEIRDDMNRRFERVDKRFDEVKFDMSGLELRLMREISKLNERITEELLWGRRELRSRKKRNGDG